MEQSLKLVEAGKENAGNFTKNYLLKYKTKLEKIQQNGAIIEKWFSTLF